MKSALPLVLLTLFVLAACASGEPERSTRVLYLAPVGSLDAASPDAIAIAWVEVAETPRKREVGLMHRESLAPESGMLFIYPDAAPRWFWMRNTKIPLSIAYADGSGRIVRIVDMEPGIGTPPDRLPQYPSREPAMYAIEMRRGWFRAKGIAEGDRIRLHPEIAAVRAH